MKSDFWWCLTCKAPANLESSACVHRHRWTPAWPKGVRDPWSKSGKVKP